MGKIKFASFSEAGVRRDNEDYCKVVTDPGNDRYLLVVCDGMGGHAMGEVASYVVCKTVCDYWQQASFVDGVESVLKASCGEASKALDAKADVLNHVEMGTTMVLAAICGNQVFLCTDGVWQYVAPYILTDRMMDDKTPEEIANVLSFLAERSSQDNFTGIVVFYE